MGCSASKPPASDTPPSAGGPGRPPQLAAQAGAPAVITPQPQQAKPEAEVVVAEAEKRSKWDEIGATALKVALRDTTLVDAAWLVELAATEGGIVPRCQDVPEHAKVALAEMEAWGFTATVGVLVIS